METYLYKCHCCCKEYKPNRRRIQKYCSNSCRSTAFKLRTRKGLNLPSKEIQKPKPNQVERMSIAGVGNAAVGTLAVNLASSLFTSEDNKPATKKDLKNMVDTLKERYHPVMNIPLQQNGAKPYYDMVAKVIVYF